jgi:hypothetical protein
MTDAGDDASHRPGRNPVDLPLSRRSVLKGAAGVAGTGMLVFAGTAGAVGVAPGGSFLTPAERKLLAAVVDRVVPGQPEDLAVGAVQTGCTEAIDALLAGFSTDPPRIFAGAPFSDRGGWPVNEFEDFLPLDDYEERAWRLRIEGAPGIAGFQQVYRDGLTALAKAQPLFAVLPGPLRDLFLRGTGNPAIVAMRDLAVTHTFELYFAAPEYGGNKALGGWKAVGFEGDRQPRGFTREEIDDPPLAPLPLVAPPLEGLLGSLVGSLLGTVTATVSGLLSAVTGGGSLPSATAAAAPVLPLAASDAAQGMVAAGSDHAAVREALGSLLAPLGDSGSEASRNLADLHRRAAEIVAAAGPEGGAR